MLKAFFGINSLLGISLENEMKKKTIQSITLAKL